MIYLAIFAAVFVPLLYMAPWLDYKAKMVKNGKNYLDLPYFIRRFL